MFGFDPVFDVRRDRGPPEPQLVPARYAGRRHDSRQRGRRAHAVGDGRRRQHRQRTTCIRPDRDLWFCDIAVDPGTTSARTCRSCAWRSRATSPIRCRACTCRRRARRLHPALARPGVSVVGSSPTSRTVTVIGRGYTATAFRNQPGGRARHGRTAPARRDGSELEVGHGRHSELQPGDDAHATTVERQLRTGRDRGVAEHHGGQAARDRGDRTAPGRLRVHREQPILPGQSERVVYTDTVLL